MLNNHDYINRLCLLLITLMLVASFLNIHVCAEDDKKPDLTISSIVGWEYPFNLTENVEKEFFVKIINQGDKNISSGENILVGLFVDGSLVSSNGTNDGLAMDETVFVNISWTPTYFDDATHILEVKVNYNYDIDEDEIDNNYWLSIATINEREPEFIIIDVDVPSFLNLNQSSTITATIKNIGRKTTKSVYVNLNSSLDGQIQKVEEDDAIYRNGTAVVELNWTPEKFGVHKIGFKVIYKDKTHDVLYRYVAVGIYSFEWWNTSWHYRYFITAKNSGNVSHVINFSSLLEDLGVVGQVFEEDTLRIVKYSQNGDANNDPVYNFNFNETSGELIWDVGTSSGVKYYCIYFDVEANSGNRIPLVEIENMSSSGSASIISSGFASGWWAVINTPIDNAYSLVGDSVDINVTTSAMADSVSAFIFLNENLSNNLTLDLNNAGDQLNWENDLIFTEKGNWTIQVTGMDDAGFETTLTEHNLYVGKPDLELKNITLTTIAHEDEKVNISAIVFCENASVEDVNVYLRINRSSNDTEVYNKTTAFDFTRNKDNVASFEWDPDDIGKYKVTIIVDYDDKIDESDETNNKMTKAVTIYDWPDLLIKNISLPDITVMEFDDVTIDIVIKNDGLVKAENYEVKLYIEKESQGFLKFLDVKDSKFFSVNSSKSVTISMNWNDAKSGRYFVGAKILTNETKKDSDLSNNYMLSDEILIIKSYEKNKPKIEDIVVEQETGEQGEEVIIKANISDDTGIQIANITVTDPNGDDITDSMVRLYGDTFQYIYTDTLEIGKYKFEIFVIDISFYENNNSKDGDFTIDRETIPPVITYAGADPIVQLKNEDIKIICYAYDNVGIESVEVTIFPSDDIPMKESLSEIEENLFVYEDSFSDIGKYTFFVTVVDQAGNPAVSRNKTFWITTDVNDTDDDGMPDWWEKKYGFDPQDPDDGEEDYDKDGITNREEYDGGINPLKDIFMENVGYRLKTNLWYIAASIIITIAIIMLVIYGKRRIF